VKRKGYAALSKHKIEVGICLTLFAWTSVSTRQAAKAIRDAKREKNKTRKTIKKWRLSTEKKLPVPSLSVKLDVEGSVRILPEEFNIATPTIRRGGLIPSF
jgi:hypothetical protein